MGAATCLTVVVTIGFSFATLAAVPVHALRNAPRVSSSLTITKLTPAIPTLDSGLVVEGRVGTLASQCDVTVRLSNNALTSRSSLTSLTSQTRTAAARRQSSKVIARTTSSGGVWSVTINAANLGLSRKVSAGVYPLVVDSLCGTATSQVATALPWLPSRKAIDPSAVVLLWPVTTGPLRNLDNTWDDATLQAQLQPFGRLRTLLDAGRDAPVSWLADPETVDTVALAAGEPDSSGQTRGRLNNSTKALATTWLAELTSIVTSQQVFALPRAMPDATLAIRAGKLPWLLAAQANAAASINDVLQTPDVVTNTVAWPCPRVTRCVNRTELTAVAHGSSTRPIVTVLPDSYAPPQRKNYWTQGALTTLPIKQSASAIVTDGILDRTLATTDGITEPALVEQRIICDLALISLERPRDARTVATTIAPGLPTEASMAGAVAAARAVSLASSAGLVRSTQLADLLTLNNSRTARRIQFGHTRSNNRLTIAASGARATTVAASQLLTRPEDKGHWAAQAFAASLNSISLAWQGRATDRKVYVTQFAATANARRAGVRVVTAKRVYLGRSQGRIPFTVINTLDVPVTIYPRISARPATRINLSEPPAELQLGPGERAGVPIGARILGSNKVTVRFSVLGSDKHVISTPASTIVSTSAYARIAGYLVLGAFVLLSLLVVNNIRRQIRRRRNGELRDGHVAIADADGESQSEVDA